MLSGTVRWGCFQRFQRRIGQRFGQFNVAIALSILIWCFLFSSFHAWPIYIYIYIYTHTHLYVNSIHTWGLCIEALLAVLFSAQKVLVDGVQRPLGDVLEVRCDFSKASCGWGLMWKKQGAGSGADPWVGGSPQRAPVGDFHAGQGNSSDNKRTHVYIYIYVFTYIQTAMLENGWFFCSSSSCSSFLRHVKGDLLRLYTYCSPCSGGRFRFCRGRCCHCRHCLSEFSRSRRSPRSKNPTTQVQTAQSLLILLWLFVVRLKHSEASGFFCMSSSIGTADFCLVQLLCHCWCRNLGFKDDDVSTFLGAAWRSCRSATTPNGSCKRPGADSRYCRQDVESPGWDWGWLFKSSKFKFPPLENR